MLHEAGVLRADCFLTNVARQRPPGNKIERFYSVNTKKERVAGPVLADGIRKLKLEILGVRPRIIIALGDTALWALTGERGITKWRGSELTYQDGDFECHLVPTYHPAAILRMWSWRFSGVIDLRRARRVLERPTRTPSTSVIRPSFKEAITLLNSPHLQRGLHSLDIETRGGHIACVGISLSRSEAFCIPFMCVERPEGYWDPQEEFEIWKCFSRLFKNSEIRWTLQNGLYDLQYFARFWGIIPKVWMDTMIAHHILLPDLPKSLDFISSIYCEHYKYWKDDGKTWDPSMGEDQLWSYNCDDCTYTHEDAEAIYAALKQRDLLSQFEFKMREFSAVFQMMLRGVNCDQKMKVNMIFSMQEAIQRRQDWVDVAVRGTELAAMAQPAELNKLPTKAAKKRQFDAGNFNVKSSKQKIQFFYTEMGIKPIHKRGTKAPSTDDDALESFQRRRPVLRPLIKRCQQINSLRTILSNHVMMRLDRDGRIRCSFNIAGTDTHRYSSSTNAFDSGTNLQNVPNPKNYDETESDIPNVRGFFIPDPGMEIAAWDLDRADAQVVAWEANDDLLKQMFREGADIHLENAKAIYNNERLTKDSPERDFAKAGVHATNYFCQPRTLARTLGITIRAAESFQDRWFSAHPGIEDWHIRTQDSINSTRSVSNKFGYSIRFFDRIDNLLPAALAWIPQSTVALVISNGLVNIHDNLPAVQPLLQEHDELVVQYPKLNRGPLLRAIKKELTIEIPYPPRSPSP